MQGSGVAAAGAQTAEQKLAQAHAALLNTRGIQFDFAGVPAPPAPPPWIEPLVKLLQAIGPALKYVFWGGVILGLALILYFIARELVPDRWFRRRKTEVAATDWRLEPAQARALLEDADGLAAAGRFEEAIHLLLFRSIDDLAGAPARRGEAGPDQPRHRRAGRPARRAPRRLRPPGAGRGADLLRRPPRRRRRVRGRALGLRDLRLRGGLVLSEATSARAPTFAAGAILALVLVGVVAAAGFVVLSAYAPDLARARTAGRTRCRSPRWAMPARRS